MKKIILLLLIPISLGSLEVDLQLLEDSGYQIVEFENYVGPYDFYNTVEEIRSIGSYLAKGFEIGSSADVNYNDKYYLYHREKLEWEEKRSSDILYISDLALVDNIENIKLILSQFLIDKYGYTEEDSLLLSQLIVIYNAIYRGDSDHYFNTYSNEAFVTPDNSLLGIDKNYYNWPGKSYIYIPLDDRIRLGDLSTVDSDLFIEEDVIQNIREESDDSIELREDIIEFKEREIEEDMIELQEVEETIISDIEAIDLEIAALEIEESVDEKEILTLETKKEELEESLKEVKEEKEELKEKEEKVLEIRDDVAVDKNIEIKEKLDLSQGILFLNTRSVKGSSMGQFYKLDDEGTVLGRSGINSIRGNNFIIVNNKIYTIAGDSDENHRISLVSILESDLSTAAISEIDCYLDGYIVSDGSNLFTVIQEDSRYYIGYFDLDLNFKGKSPVEVNKDTFISTKASRIYIQGTDNSLRWVNLSDFVAE